MCVRAQSADFFSVLPKWQRHLVSITELFMLYLWPLTVILSTIFCSKMNMNINSNMICPYRRVQYFVVFFVVFFRKNALKRRFFCGIFLWYKSTGKNFVVQILRSLPYHTNSGFFGFFGRETVFQCCWIFIKIFYWARFFRSI